MFSVELWPRPGGPEFPSNGKGRLHRLPGILAACCALLFVAVGAFSLDSLGVQTDEASFAAGIYGSFNRANVMSVFHKPVPLMVLTYYGTVKSWIYRPVFALFGVTAYSVRLPALLIGGCTIWLFYRLVARTAGRTAAVVGCALLATDPVFLLTIRWDWGPVAIQHFCLVGGLAALAAWHQEQRARWLAAGFFLFGLGLWDKAVFVWSLAGVAAAAFVVLPREILRAARQPLNVAIACTFFLLGALPLLIYNVRHQGVTFRTNGNWSASNVSAKARLLAEMAQGRGFHGVIATDAQAGRQREPETGAARLLVRLDEACGQPRRSLAWVLWIAGLLLAPFLRRTRGGAAAAFALVFCAVAWGFMALSGGSASAHHAVLIWPMPYMALAPALAAAACRFGRRGKALLGAAVVAAALSNLLVTATYYRDEIRNGGAPAWTDAFNSLSRELDAMRVRRVGLLDWGFFDNLRLFHQGRLEQVSISVPANANQKQFIGGLLRDP
ncbi:MAG TPA: glycosyltransferase family 39 protein, partial [Bryobacteraceae bacterium]|nr:glycosyltransferase family 39 protein [Bryobacteraceae bacterium]